MKTRKIVPVLLAMGIVTTMALTGCGNKIDCEATFATLGDTKVSMGVANFMAKYQQSTYDKYYKSYFGDDMWNTDLYGSGSTLQEDVKSDVSDNLQEMYLLKAHMEDYDVTLTEDDEKAITQAAEKFMNDNSKSALNQVGATSADYVEEVLRLYTIQNKMKARIIEDADTTVTDEEAAQRTFSYVQISTNGKNDEDGNFVEYTDEEKTALMDTATAIATANDFDVAVEDAGYTVSTQSYGSAEDEDASMDKAVLEAADALTEGQVSGVIETDNAYYVIRLDSAYDKTATENKREQLINQKQEDYYNNILDGWKDETEWSVDETEWGKVTFKDGFSAPADTESVDVTDTEN